jgi:membrane-associated phospholipid phosphatase
MTATDDDHTTRQPTTSRHGPVAQLLIAWSPLSVILVVYGVAAWVNAPLTDDGVGGALNRLGFGLHEVGPARVDAAVFGGVPSVWLQQHLVDGSAHWYDAVAALVYITHFVAIPVVTGLVWFRIKERFTAWLAAVLTFTAVGVAGYLVYPATPPWLASDQGRIGAVDRISLLGWDYLHLDAVADLVAAGQRGSNPVAAMPSLHAGAALLVTLFLWPSVRGRWRAALVLYVASMALTLVYTGEHYVVDVAGGWLTATVAVVVGAAVLRAGRRQK